MMLQVSHLRKAFGGVQAVDDVSFELPSGTLLALIGPNGAGKSTCFNLINGQLRPDSGEVLLDGQRISGMPARAIAHLGVGRTFQVPAVFGSLTVLENVQIALAAHARHIYRWWRQLSGQYREEALGLLAQVGMQEQVDRVASVLAYGDVKRLELAMALSGRPKVLLMDEPTAGMAMAERHQIMNLTRELVTRHNLAVLFTEHSLDVVFTHADRVVVMARGRIIASGSPEAIHQDPLVREVYLGGAPVPSAPPPAPSSS